MPNADGSENVAGVALTPLCDPYTSRQWPNSLSKRQDITYSLIHVDRLDLYDSDNGASTQSCLVSEFLCELSSRLLRGMRGHLGGGAVMV
jgi:hypothetical protein